MTESAALLVEEVLPTERPPAPVGVECALRAALPARPRSAGPHPRARHRLPLHRRSPHRQGRPHLQARAHPALATERLALTAGGAVRYTLKTPYRDGTTHVLFEPRDFLARLAALVPLPRVHLTRFHGLFAPHARLRAAITPAGRGGARAQPGPPQHHAMGWMQRLKRAFRIDIEPCQRCGGKLRVIASIEDPELIHRILEHLEGREPSAPPAPLARAPPATQLTD